MLKNDAKFLEKAIEECSPGMYKLCGHINTHCNHLKTHF